jgi:hypothetical protein
MKSLLQPDRGAAPRQKAPKRSNVGLVVTVLGLLVVGGACLVLSLNEHVEETAYSPTSNSSKLASTRSDRTFPAPAAPSGIAPSPAAPSPAAPSTAAPSPAAPTSPAVPVGGAAPASVTADHPFVNSLGMKFAPVEITGGPTNGKRVLFSVWDTRVQDYAEFARENRFTPEKISFEQSPTHPVVRVNWQDAKAFCNWLTNKERAAGKIGKDEQYRLPTDHEWSCAVGIGRRERAEESPESKRSQLGPVYPWGTQWPPPKGAGNYDPKFNVDNFEFTSPVGSFAPNQYGLYDMGGNVWQWCEDLFSSENDHRVLRGGAYFYDVELCLRSSFRYNYEPTARLDIFGFRCVLVNQADTGKPASGSGNPASGKPAKPASGPTNPQNGGPSQSTPAPTTPSPRGIPGTHAPTTPLPSGRPGAPAPNSSSPRNTPPPLHPGSVTPPWTL